LSNRRDVNDCVQVFTKIVQDELYAVMPLRTITVRPRDKPGMNSIVRGLFRKTHRLHRIARETKLPIDQENHRLARSLAKKTWRKAQKYYYYVKLNSSVSSVGSEIRNYWKTIKSIYGGSKIYWCANAD